MVQGRFNVFLFRIWSSEQEDSKNCYFFRLEFSKLLEKEGEKGSQICCFILRKT